MYFNARPTRKQHRILKRDGILFIILNIYLTNQNKYPMDSRNLYRKVTWGRKKGQHIWPV